MPHRSLYLAALIVGFGYWLGDHLLAPGVAHVVWKGAGVGLLAVWAMLAARTRDGWLLATVMALGAAGDVLLEVAGRTVGAAAFLMGHLTAIWLYWRNRRAGGIIPGVALLVVTPLVGWLLTHDPAVALYATGLGAMAASAWRSRFPRGQVATGAMLFVVSDWLIFARGGLPAWHAVPDLMVWPTYFAGQALIAWAVVRTLEADA